MLTAHTSTKGQNLSINQNRPCNIYFATFSITITLNKQMSPKKLFLNYTIPYTIGQV